MKSEEIKTDYDEFIRKYLDSDECIDLSKSEELKQKIEYYETVKKRRDFYKTKFKQSCGNDRGGICSDARKIMERSNVEKKCVLCGFCIVVEVHHIIPIKDGGKNVKDNLVYLCPNCHSMVHKGIISLKIPKDL